MAHEDSAYGGLDEARTDAEAAAADAAAEPSDGPEAPLHRAEEGSWLDDAFDESKQPARGMTRGSKVAVGVCFAVILLIVFYVALNLGIAIGRATW